MPVQQELNYVQNISVCLMREPRHPDFGTSQFKTSTNPAKKVLGEYKARKLPPPPPPAIGPQPLYTMSPSPQGKSQWDWGGQRFLALLRPSWPQAIINFQRARRVAYNNISLSRCSRKKNQKRSKIVANEPKNRGI